MSASNDSLLSPILEALNSRTVTPSDKARRMLDYRNVMISKLVRGAVATPSSSIPALAEISAMRRNDHPLVWLSGDLAGVFMPLFRKLADDMPLQLIVDWLAGWVLCSGGD